MSKLLLVVDVQNDFVSGVLGSKEAPLIVPKIVDYVKNFDGEVIFTRDVHDEVYYFKNIEGKKIPIHCVSGTEGSEIVEVLKPYAKCVWNKDHFGCKLDPMQLNLKYDIEICGLVTDICVLNIALNCVNSYCNSVTVLSDLCAGTTPENHQKALDIMRVNCIEVL